MRDARDASLEPLLLPSRSWLFVPIAALILAASLVMGFIAKSAGVFSPELALSLEASEGRNPFFTAIALGIHYALAPVGATVLLAFICVWLMLRRKPLQSLGFGSITAIGWLSSEVGKYTVARPRPSATAVHALILETSPDSFPSGHTAFAASLAIAVTLVLARPGAQRWIAAGAGAFFVAVVAGSRLYLGVHYPTDLIGSVLLSCAAIMFWLALWNKLVQPRLVRSRLLSRIASREPQPAAVRL